MSPTVLWIIAGVFLCVMEFITPTAFVELMMGVGALFVGLLSLIIPYFPLQVALWLILSTGLIITGRKVLMPKKQLFLWEEEREGETLTSILPGKTGRVLFEGVSWRAKCENENLSIEPNEKVYIVEQKGNTLIVLPQSLLK